MEYALAEPSLFGDFELSLQRVRGESTSEDPRSATLYFIDIVIVIIIDIANVAVNVVFISTIIVSTIAHVTFDYVLTVFLHYHPISLLFIESIAIWEGITKYEKSLVRY